MVETRIAVIGHPLITFTSTIVTLAAFTTYPTGEKMIMPGVIVAVEEPKLTYECWTMAGVAGGPIIDLATGESRPSSLRAATEHHDSLSACSSVDRRSA